MQHHVYAGGPIDLDTEIDLDSLKPHCNESTISIASVSHTLYATLLNSIVILTKHNDLSIANKHERAHSVAYNVHARVGFLSV